MSVKNYFRNFTKFVETKTKIMKQLLLILLCFPMSYGCQQQVKEYNESNVIHADSLDIESVKIKTH
jgi:hypothetical protein